MAELRKDPKPNSLLIRNIHTLATMDADDRRLSRAFIYAEDGEIKIVGENLPPDLSATRTIDGSGCVAIPGLINTHHHFFQTLTRAVAAAADVELFGWLRTLYPLWARIDREAVEVAALVAMAELMLSGCTTTSDHHYLFPAGQTELIDTEIAAAQKIGMRFTATRGSMSVGESKGGLPPESVVQDEDTILQDCERLIRTYHDPKPGSMVQVALAPCSPFSVSSKLMRDTAAMAERENVRLHTHLAETRDEETYCREHFGMRPLELLDSLGWLTNRTWVAHGIHFNAAEINQIGRARVGVAHCPTSNMRLGSGLAPALALQKTGARVGLGVDGSASNDSSNMLAEARQALLLQRLANGAAAISVTQALRMATTGGAQCLGRTDIGSLEPGMRADIALFDLRDPVYSGAEDPVAALLLCAPTAVRTLVVEGRVVVDEHKLTTINMEPILALHRGIAAHITGKQRFF
jgi:cytosine/adenosine deaminase-related metal-dependent hydrolase